MVICTINTGVLLYSRPTFGFDSTYFTFFFFCKFCTLRIVLYIFYPAMNKLTTHNDIWIYTFQNDWTSLLEWKFKSKVIERGDEVNSWAFFLKMYLVGVVTFFFSPIAYLRYNFFSSNTNAQDSCFCWSSFVFKYQNANSHQFCQGGEIVQGDSIHKFAWTGLVRSCDK